MLVLSIITSEQLQKYMSRKLPVVPLQGMLTQKLIRKQEYLATVDRSHEGLQDTAAQVADDKAAAASAVSHSFFAWVDTHVSVQHLAASWLICSFSTVVLNTNQLDAFRMPDKMCTSRPAHFCNLLLRF